MSRKNTQVEWTEFSWPGVYPIQCLPPQKAWCFDFAKYGYPLSKMAMFFTNDVSSFYAIKVEYEQHGKALFERTLKDQSFILTILKETNLAAGKIFRLERKWRSLNFRVMSNRQLLQYHKELFEIDEILWRKGQVQNLLEMGNNFVTAYVRENLVSLYGSKKEIWCFQAISTPTYLTRNELQDRDFVKLCGKFKSEKNIFKKEALIERHWQKYRWMNYGWVGPAITLETFHRSVKGAVRQPKILNKVEDKFVSKVKLLLSQKVLLKKLPLPSKNMCLVLRKIMNAKARRADAHSLTYFLADPLLSEIGKRLGLSLNQLRVMDPPRVRTLFKKLDVNEINEELKYVAYWYEKGKAIKKYVGLKAENKMRPVLAGLPKVTKQTELAGEMAYPGKVKGKVAIILKAKDIGKFKKGEILVTGMTDPGFVPAMKIAKAIVTNYGGITCHAAIISRELQVPCVIGTKIATKVFKDGDLVEVDANKGIVRKIKV